MTTTTKKPKITALAPWYGGNRMLAEHVGKALNGCEWVGIPFAGGMCEIGHITSRTIMVNDKHEFLIDLAEAVSHPPALRELTRRLADLLFHPKTLRDAQRRLWPSMEGRVWLGERDRWQCAEDFFVVAWMTRSGTAGTSGEHRGKLALRWEAGGGDSVKRYHSAIDALPYWAEEFKRCQFSTLDCFDFLGKCKDRDRHGIYCDPPFPGPGDKYAHTFDEEQHGRLAERLSEYEHCRVVCRFYDHPLIRELYAPENGWEWMHLEGRKQTNDKAPEVLLCRN